MTVKKKKAAVKKKKTATKKAAVKRKVTHKKRAKKKIAARKRVRSEPFITTAVNNYKEDDIVYVNGTGKPPNGRPSKSVKLSQIQGLASIGCTQLEMAAICGMNKDTFTILKKNNPIIKEIIDAGRAEGKGSLRRKQHHVAMQGDPSMLRWLGKNRLKQSDRIQAHIETSAGDTLRRALMGESDDDQDDDDDL